MPAISTIFKAVIFDLDDTLYDCSGTLIAASRRRSAEVLIKAGLPMSVDEAVSLQADLATRHGPHFLVFDEIGRRYDLDDKILAEAYRAYNAESVDAPISLFPDTLPTINQLKSLGLQCFLLTVGHHARQKAKIQKLGLDGVFDDCIINDYDRGSIMSECLRYYLQKHDLQPGEVVMVGDRPGEEVRHGNELGMVTIQFMHGRFSFASPRDEFEYPDYKISNLFQIPAILKLASIGKTPDIFRIVALGGGTGLPVILKGCKTYCDSPAAIVAVTDSGRSTGKLRKELGIIAPGDIRNCLVALSEPGETERRLNSLFQYRFQNGSLEGMSLGNLIITAMAELEGGFEKGVSTISNLLSIKGSVIPSTLSSANICAELKDGALLHDEVSVSAPNKPPIKNVFLAPQDSEAPENAVSEILKADLVVLGPGSLYTSIIPNILVPDIRQALKETSAKICYVANIVTQPGETDGYSCSDHLIALHQHLGFDGVDAVLVNSSRPDPEILRKYESEGAALITPDAMLNQMDVQVIATDLCENFNEPRVLWEKQDLLRHDPHKLGDAVCRYFVGLSTKD